jgi:hypothetical protein
MNSLTGRSPIRGETASTYVHVSVERFIATRGDSSIEELVARAERLRLVLEAAAAGWQHPTADEAVLELPENRAPWRSPSPAAGQMTPLDWAETLSLRVRSEVGMSCSVGIAKTLLAARACSRLAQPSGVLLLLPGYEKELLWPLPLDELDELRPEQVHRLRQHGLRTVSDIATLAPESAARIVGVAGVIDLLRVSTSLTDPPRTKGDVRGRHIADLAIRIARGLESQRLYARGLALRLEYESGAYRERFVALPEPTRQPEEVLRAGQRLYARLANASVGRLSCISLSARGLSSGTGQLDLFGRSRPREVERSVYVGGQRFFAGDVGSAARDGSRQVDTSAGDSYPVSSSGGNYA